MDESAPASTASQFYHSLAMWGARRVGEYRNGEDVIAVTNDSHSGAGRSMARWMFAPAIGEAARSNVVAQAGLRVLVGLLWIYNVAWKKPPDFGQDSGRGVYGFTSDAVEHPVLAPFSWVVEHLVLPNFTVFGWGVLVVETVLAVLLLTGAYVRLAALIGIAQSLVIGLSVAATPGEWPWSYWLMIGLHVVLLFGVAGAAMSVDALRARPSNAESIGRSILLLWGVVVSLAAIVTVARSVGEDPLTASGAALGGPGTSISLGSYNLVGSVLLLATGLGLLAATQLGPVVTGRVTAAIALLAAISLYVQLPFTDPWLGGSNTSAAFFLSIAVIAAVVPRSSDSTRS